MTSLTVARGTLLECLRDRVLYLPVIFVIFLLFGSVFLGSLSLGEMERLAVDFGVMGITFFSLLTAVFLGIGWSYQGVTRRTAYALLARPVSRRSVLWGSFLGLVVIQLVSLVLMGSSWALILRLAHVELQAIHWMSLALLFVEILLVTALAFFLSTVASPAVAGATTVVLVLAGYGSRSLLDLAEQTSGRMVQGIAQVGYYAIPCLSNFYPAELGYTAAGGPAGAGLWAAFYGVAYAVGLITCAAAVFSRRELA